MVHNVEHLREAQKYDLYTLPSVKQGGDIVLGSVHVRERRTV